MSASLTGFCGGHSGTSFSSRVDELVDLALGLEPDDIAFDRVFMHFARFPALRIGQPFSKRSLSSCRLVRVSRQCGLL